MKIDKAYSILGLIKRNFVYRDKNAFIVLYKSLVRPHVEYANCDWVYGYLDGSEKSN